MKKIKDIFSIIVLFTTLCIVFVLIMSVLIRILPIIMWKEDKKMNTIGDNMRLARKRNNLTLMKLAELSGISYQIINKYEMDKTMPGVDKVEILADVLGISIDEYIGHNVKKPIDIKKKMTDKEMLIELIKEVEEILVKGVSENVWIHRAWSVDWIL